MPEEKKLFTVTILITDRQNQAGAINQFLTETGHLFLGRMGIPLARRCWGKCASIITLIAEANSEEITDFEKQLIEIKNITVKIIPLN